MEQQSKPWYQSVTIWLNILLVILAAINQVNEIVTLPPDVMAFILGATNVLVRFKTIAPIK